MTLSPGNAPRQARILFVHNRPTRFVRIDHDLLQRRHLVTEYYERSWRGVSLSKVARAVRCHDLVFCWFASWHSFLPVVWAQVCQKPSIVVIGGYDVANLPEIGYGSQRSGLRRWVTRTVIHKASRIIVTSGFSRCEAVRNAHADPGKVSLLYPGVQPFPAAENPKQNLILTVGDVNRDNLERKGLLPFVEAARLFPNYAFVLAGAWQDHSIDTLRTLAPPNVRFPGKVSDGELASLYRSAKVYVQASRHEGFGMSLAEAMSAECIPVVTRAGSLPEVVGDTGIFIDSPDPLDIAQGIRAALEFNGRSPERVRARVEELFSLDRRYHGLCAVVDALLQPPV